MSEEESISGPDQVQESVQEAVGKNEDISEAVRKITLDALSKKSLDYDSIRSTLRDVLEGAKMGAKDDGEIKAAFQQVTSGLDEALAQSAEASKLAIEETAGRVRDFNKQDLKRALDELSGLEDLFIETIGDAAKSSQGMLTEVFTDLANHARTNGTVVGKRIAEDVSMLRNKLGQSGKEQASELTDAAKMFSANVASAASGFLAGIAETLQKSGKK